MVWQLIRRAFGPIRSLAGLQYLQIIKHFVMIQKLMRCPLNNNSRQVDVWRAIENLVATLAYVMSLITVMPLSRCGLRGRPKLNRSSLFLLEQQPSAAARHTSL